MHREAAEGATGGVGWRLTTTRRGAVWRRQTLDELPAATTKVAMRVVVNGMTCARHHGHEGPHGIERAKRYKCLESGVESGCVKIPAALGVPAVPR